MKYIISVGHTASGNIGCGAVDLLDESKCTREIAPLVVSKLQALGYEAVKLQIDNSDKYDYVKRTNQANSIGGDIFVEIHLNAGGGTGTEVYTTNGSKATPYAEKVSQCIANKLGIANRGHKNTGNLYVLSHTSMPAMLIECCFVDNRTDYNAYNADKIATAIVEGLTGQSVYTTSSDKHYIVTNYLPNGYKGDGSFDGVDANYVLQYFNGIRCYFRGNEKGVWIETQELPLNKCEELENILGSWFYEIK